MTHTVQIPQANGGSEFPGYIAEPEKKATAAIVVIQEAFGVNAGIRRRCDMLAEAGYLAIAPDLFWRVEPGIELDPDVKSELDRGLQLLNDFDQDQAVKDIQSAVAFAREKLGGSGKVGALGYCIGGKLAFLTASRTDADVSVGYYGYGIDQVLDEASHIKIPFLLHLGRADQFIDAVAQDKIERGFKGQENLDVEFYVGAGHGFATEFGERRNVEAAVKADQRTAQFFADKLL